MGTGRKAVKYAYANYLDVTEQQNMLEELQRSKALLEKAVAHAKVHYIRYEARTGLTTINREVAELYGFSSVMDDYPRQLCRPDALYPADYRLYCDKFEEVRGGRKKEVVFNARIRDHSEGEYIWRKVRFTGSYDLEGKLVRIDGVSQDVNEYLEQEKRGMAE